MFYARLASEYVELLMTSSTPTKDLSEMHNYSATSMRDFLNQARARGLLTRPQRGQAGGQLTEDALKLLAEHGKSASDGPYSETNLQIQAHGQAGNELAGTLHSA